ncbi:hypothetical protein E2P81_ATG08240 [Venturia nashicola]|nr:hypothetical protein E2P81_ATG08240 [Venturia nashicola]
MLVLIRAGPFQLVKHTVGSVLTPARPSSSSHRVPQCIELGCFDRCTTLRPERGPNSSSIVQCAKALVGTTSSTVLRKKEDPDPLEYGPGYGPNNCESCDRHPKLAIAVPPFIIQNLVFYQSREGRQGWVRIFKLCVNAAPDRLVVLKINVLARAWGYGGDVPKRH